MGIWAVLEADITGTLSLRKTKKSYVGRRKILEEPAREESTKSLTLRQKRGEKEVEGSKETSSPSHAPEPTYHHECKILLLPNGTKGGNSFGS